MTGRRRLVSSKRSFADVWHSVLEYLSREDADRGVRQLDGKELRGQTVRVLADYEVRLPRVRLGPLLILLFSVAPITTAEMNAETTAIVKTVIDIVRNAHLPTAANARALLLPAARFMTVGRGLPHEGRVKTVGRPVTRGGRIVAPQNHILARFVTTAAGTKGSGMKRMTDLTTALLGSLTAMRASGKLTRKSHLKRSLEFAPLRIGENRLFWRRIHVSDALWFTYLPVFSSVARHSRRT